ncbi:MAG TPA: transposase [Bacteroidota bacterium]|nr:transposase [Bacteroidota bacterium]
MGTRRRNSLRLSGYDYSRPGGYFVTICTAGRRCILGKVVDGKVELSHVGKIVESCWRQISDHFPGIRVSVFQIMPNHVHGIIEIKEDARRGVQLNAPTGNRFSKISPKKGTLGVIVRTFKAAVLTGLRKAGKSTGDSIWQRSFYDHIIRDDVDHFFVNRYIELNPLLWYMDSDNPEIRDVSFEQLRDTLSQKYGLDGFALGRLIEHELAYREWR